jgi:hypothetical protein
MTKTVSTKKGKLKVVPAFPEPEAPASQPEQEYNLTELLGEMSDFELVQVGLVVMALLHKRAEAANGSGK